MFRLVRPALFALSPETAHELTLAALALAPARRGPAPDPVLATRFAGLAFPSPVGLAAGFDKDARVWRQMLGLGFGFAEVGTLTPRPQAGNPRPRIFRLSGDAAVINRLGFNNGGLEAALPRLAQHGRLGVNVGANKDSADRIADYVTGVRAVRDLAAWITLNISSPNTPGLRGLQGDALPELLAAAAEARGPGGAGPAGARRRRDPVRARGGVGRERHRARAPSSPGGTRRRRTRRTTARGCGPTPRRRTR